MSGPGQLFRGSIGRWWDKLRRIHARRRAAEVFPWLEHSAAACAIVGAIAGSYFGIGGLILGAIVGTLIGAWLALNWASEIVENEPGPDKSDLWDAWLDETRDDIQLLEVVESDVEIVNGRARVRPRVYTSDGESLPLEEEIGSIFVNHERGAILLIGPDGSGKSTALAHLARLIPPHLQVAFLEQPDRPTLLEASEQGRVVYTSAGIIPNNLLTILRLAPWAEDEWIEYLLAGDRSLCAPVMNRLSLCQGVERELLEGTPELWKIALDQMASDGSIEGPRQALRAEFDRIFSDRDYRNLIGGDCLVALVVQARSGHLRLARLRNHGPDESLFRLIRHRAIQLLLAADRITDILAEGRRCRTLAKPLPRDLVREAALQIAGRPEALERLREFIAGYDEAIHPMTASLLHAAGIGWKPTKPMPRLQGAYLQEASWAGVVLVEVDLEGVDLSRADLWGARFDRACLAKAKLTYVDLRNASLEGTDLQSADLRRARLAKARAVGARFEAASLEGADFEDAILDDANFQNADLTDAKLAKASLVGADLSRAKVDGAEFTNANLSKAILCEMKLAGGRFEGARFTGADLSKSDLENMALPRADFAGANFSEALLTGANMPGANFRNAIFSGAGLAEVEWERADLRGADFRNASFHLGSSRSGLVDSTIACEGSRTGFYTDDDQDQHFKSPEEIRKANLQGVDLRGAILNGVDFYLVDLRGAKLDPEQLPHLRHSGAILESRV